MALRMMLPDALMVVGLFSVYDQHYVLVGCGIKPC